MLSAIPRCNPWINSRLKTKACMPQRGRTWGAGVSVHDEGRHLHRREHLHTVATYQHMQQAPSPPCLQAVRETVDKQVQDIASLRHNSHKYHHAASPKIDMPTLCSFPWPAAPLEKRSGPRLMRAS